MKFAAFILALAMGSASAFIPSTRVSRPVARLAAEQQDRREFGAAAAAALVGAGFAQSAKAEAGAGPKFSLFGVTKGQATSFSEGAAYGTDQSQPVYSPYSPYSPASEKSLYATVDNSAAYKATLAESEKRFANYPGYIQRKAWFEVKDENTRYLYNLRKAMNGLAKTKESKAAASKVFGDLEALTYSATVKSPEKATAAYESLLADFKAYKATI